MRDGECPHVRTYTFATDDSGRLVGIEVIAHVEHPERFASKWGFSHNVLRMDMRRDEDLYQQVISELQALESFAAFRLNITKFNWEFAQYEVIPESDEEARIAGIFKGPQFYPIQRKDSPAIAAAQDIEAIVLDAGRYSELTTLVSYWREGMNDMRTARYVNAFVQFYFILEGEFADGEYRSKEIRARFRASQEFTDMVEEVLKSLPTDEPMYHAQLLRMMNRKTAKTMSVEDILVMLTRARRECQHFKQGEEKAYATPLRHLDYEAVAYTTLRLATGTIRTKGMALQAQKWNAAEK